MLPVPCTPVFLATDVVLANFSCANSPGANSPFLIQSTSNILGAHFLKVPVTLWA